MAADTIAISSRILILLMFGEEILERKSLVKWKIIKTADNFSLNLAFSSFGR